MKFPIVPLGISLAVAGVDGLVASDDVNNGRTQLRHQRTLWVQGGAAGIGLVGEFLGWDQDYTEPLMFTGAALFTREVAFKMAQGSRGSSSVPPQGYKAYVGQPAPAIGAPAPALADPLARPAIAAPYGYQQVPTRVA